MTTANPQKSIPALDDGPTARAFRAVEAALRSHEGLDAAVRIWRTLEGWDTDLLEPEEGQCPLLALSPFPIADEAKGLDYARCNLGIRVRVVAEGTCFNDVANLWDLVRDALRLSRPYQGTTLGAYLACDVPGVQLPGLWVADVPFTVRLPLLNSAGAATRNLTIGDGSIRTFFQRPA